MHDKSYEDLEEEMGPAEKPPVEATLLSLRLFINQEGLFIKEEHQPVEAVRTIAHYIGLPMNVYHIAMELFKSDYEYIASLLEEGDDG